MLAPTDAPCCTPCPLPQACPLYKFKAGVRHQYISVCLPGGYLPCCPGKRGFLALLPWEEWVLALKGVACNLRWRQTTDPTCTPMCSAAGLQPPHNCCAGVHTILLACTCRHCRRRSPLTLLLPCPPLAAADAGCTGLATYIVEPNFKDTLSVAHPTPRYAALLDSLPPAVVASKVRWLPGGALQISGAATLACLHPWWPPACLLA